MKDFLMTKLSEEVTKAFRGLSTPHYDYYGDDLTTSIVTNIFNSVSDLVCNLEKVVIHYTDYATDDIYYREIRERLETINRDIDNDFERLRNDIRKGRRGTAILNCIMADLAEAVLEVENLMNISIDKYNESFKEESSK